MAQMITWDNCFYSVANAHFNAAYANIILLIVSLVFFGLFYLWPILYDRSDSLKRNFDEGKAESIARGLLLAGVFCLAAYVVWFTFFFKPDAIQAQVSELQGMMSGMSLVERLL